MGEISFFQKHKLIVGILTTLYDRIDEIIKTLSDEIGEIDFVSDLMDFNYTDYYNSEMGDNIKRLFVSFRKHADPSSLAKIKIHTNYLERLFITRDHENNELRKVNFDPGMLCSSRLILASTKDNVHRIPLSDGIYGEVTLIYRRGKFEHLPWTYADYKSDEYSIVLSRIRDIYKADLKTGI